MSTSLLWAGVAGKAAGGVALGAVACIAALAIACKLSKRFSHFFFSSVWVVASPHVNNMMKRKKQALFEESLRGDVLEIGSGTGVNLQFYATDELKDRITSVTMVEPNPHLHAKSLERIAQSAALPFNVSAIADSYPSPKVADRTFDTIVCALVLCSVHDLEGTIRALHAQLRPGGRLILLEHIVPEPHSTTRVVAKAINPIWGALGDGCSLLRDTEAAVRACEWSAVNTKIVNPSFPIWLAIGRVASRTLMGYAQR